MSKIGTEQDAYNLSGIGTPIPNKCITATRVRELGCSIFDEDTFPVADNQLVEKERLEIKTTRYFGAIVTIANSGMGDVVSCVYPYYKSVPSQEPSTYMVRWDLIDYHNDGDGTKCYFGRPEDENNGKLYVNYDITGTSRVLIDRNADWYIGYYNYFWLTESKLGFDVFYVLPNGKIQ